MSEKRGLWGEKDRYLSSEFKGRSIISCPSANFEKMQVRLDFEQDEVTMETLEEGVCPSSTLSTK